MGGFLECTPAFILYWLLEFVQLFNHQIFDFKFNYNFLRCSVCFLVAFCFGRFLLCSTELILPLIVKIRKTYF